MVAGVAVFDYNNDGLPDLHFVNGARIPDLRKTGPQYYNRLYRNNGDGTFTDVTERAGVKADGYSMGVAAADYDPTMDGRTSTWWGSIATIFFITTATARSRTLRKRPG
ncbi:MAG: FG-GAP repeat domain-containing protein [Terriglobia bacterium]